MPNCEIRIAAMAARVPLWRVAEELGIADSSLSRKLRRELSEEERKRIFAIIDKLALESI